MIVSAAIVSEKSELFCSNKLPYELQLDISKHANNFLYSLSLEDSEIELPYIESTDLRYIYKQTGDLYWLLVTKIESDLFNDIRILGKFVCTIMEYGSSETNSSTITDKQRELFYRHIWRPWDEAPYCPFCSGTSMSPEMWWHEFESRLNFLVDLSNGELDDKDVDYFNALMSEAWLISAKLSPKWMLNGHERLSDSESVCSDQSRESISEEAVIDGCKLKCQLEDIRIELARIQDPYLRLFAKRNLLLGSSYYNPDKAISSAPTFKELESDGSCENDDLEQTKQM